MNSDAITRLLKVLSLERRQDFRNKAVIGGLDKFASRWENDARAEVANAEAINEIVALMLGYPAVGNTAARERILEQIVRRAKEASGALAETKTPPPPGSSAQPEAAEPGSASTDIAEPPNAPIVAAAVPAGATDEIAMPALSKPVLESEAPAHEPAPPSVRFVPAASKPDVAAEAPHPKGPGQQPSPVPGRRRPQDRPTVEDTGLDAPVTKLPNIGPQYARKLAKLGVRTIRDLLYLLPYRYEDYSSLRTIDQLSYGEQVTVIGTVWNLQRRTIAKERRMITAVVGDGTGEMQMTWFNPYVERRLRTGRAYAFSGKVDSYRGRLLIRNPQFEPLESQQIQTGRLVPIYPLTEGITARWLRRVIKRAIDAWAGSLPDFLPASIRQGADLLPLTKAIAQIHFPDNQTAIDAAHRRLSFDEFFILQLGVLNQRRRFRELPARPLNTSEEVLAPFVAALPFSMTGAQQRALASIAADLQTAQPMSRLLQGDVGSGKTAVAAAALWVAVANGAQGAIMAPTEILAEQHARSFGRLFSRLAHPRTDRPIRVALLTGSMARAEKKAALAALSSGEIDIAVGTHALIQNDVTFENLAVAVVDEQHRFGVEQRAALRQKGLQPHMLVMSATPIPRSLALTIYGDLDISVIDEMPPGRTSVKTKWLLPDQRERSYAFIRRQVAEGRQAFVIYPLVEETETSEARAAVNEYERLAPVVFPDQRVGLLHGRMKGEEKDAIMRAFGDGKLDILIATSVVEVGIDVPNASVVMIDGAERFGLAQLHQFRGRVGRGEYPSYCILISGATEGESVRRLRALEETNDGFALAQIDLEMRGPGDFFGTRQSGLPPLTTARLSDLQTLELARAAAQKLFAEDPDLSRPEHQALAAQVANFWQGAGDIS